MAEVRIDRPELRNRAFISQRTPSTPLERLSRALARTGEAGGRALQIAEERELADAEELLRSPLVTEEEIAEITRDSFFPQVKIKAANRQGQLQVENAREEIAQALRDAPDALAARQMLRERQAQMLDLTEDVSVQAGIREAFAEVAPSLLSTAATRRAQLLDERDNEIQGALFQGVLEQRPEEFTNNLVQELNVEVLTGGDIPAFHTRAVTGMANFYLEGDDEDGLNNTRTRTTLQTIDQVLKSNVVQSGAERAKYVKLRETIERDEIARQKAREGQAGLDDIHAAWQRRVTAWVDANPNQPIPQDLRKLYLDSAHTAAASRSALEFLDGVETRANPKAPGAAGLPAFKNGREILKKAVEKFDPNTGVFLIGTEGLAALEYYDSIASTLDPDVGTDPLRAQQAANELRREAVGRAESIAVEQEARRARQMQEFEVVNQRFPDPSDPDRVRLLQELAERQEQERVNAWREEARRQAAILGLDLDEDLVNLWDY